jgi:hypothetical protein
MHSGGLRGTELLIQRRYVKVAKNQLLFMPQGAEARSNTHLTVSGVFEVLKSIWLEKLMASASMS